MRERGAETCEHHPDIERVLFTPMQIQQRVKELGEELGRVYEGQVPIYLCVLKGAMVFLADLMRATPGPVEVDFMAVSSYGARASSSGVIRIIKDLDRSIEGRHVVLVEDIVDSGHTLQYLMDLLLRRHVASLRVVPFLLRSLAVKNHLPPEHHYGFVLPPGDSFVVGYGLDYAEKYRNLSCVAALKPSVYQDAKT